MLGKLLKYELKSTSRLMGVLYLAVLIVAAIVGFLARGTIWQATQGNAIAVVVSGLIYTLLIMTLMIVTVVMILQRFYKNLLKGEGYLIWVLLSIITLIVSVFVLVLTSVAGSGNLFALDWCSLPWGDFFKFFQESAGEIILTIVAAVIQIVRIILLVYTAMAIGAAAKRHKVFYSVLTFIVILIIIAIIGTLTNFNLIEMLNGSMAVDNAGIGVPVDAGKGMVVAGYVKLLAGQCITDAIYSVIFFFVTTWFLKNKLNLE